MATSSFFYPGGTPPEQNSVTELLSELEAGVSSASASAESAAASAAVAQSASTTANTALTGAQAAIATTAGQVTAATNAATTASAAAATATTKASEASSSASSAASSASSASTSATAAASSASTASTAATNAATSASTASTGATTATAKAAEALTSAGNAGTSATNAAASATSASNSASSASTSATNAATSASSAAASATTATSAASGVTASANSAAASASAASTSATNAAASATQAANSATAASTSATNASNSATSASTSATTATTQATNASNSATAAAGSATSASTSASTATTQATNAATSATNAAASEANALSYKNAAATSATNASTSATAAATSATNASSSATSAANSAASASAVVLGNEPVRPTIRPSLLLDFANTKQLDPRITFTRASTATYYDGKTTAMAEQNLLTYSQDFDNAAWAKDGVAVTANSTVSPDGTTTADTITATAVNGRHYLNEVSLGAAGSFSFSVYVKAGTSNFCSLGFYTASASYVAVTFNLSTAAVTQTITSGAVLSGVSSSITASTNGFYRLTVSLSSTSGVYAHAQINSSATPTISSFGVEVWTAVGTETVYLWGAQLEQRSAVTAYTTTTTAAITNYIPALQTAASGVARFDHNPTTGESLGLLIEEQRTNLAYYSQDFSNAAWTSTNLSVSTTAVVAPDGTLTGNKIVENTVNGVHGFESTTNLFATAAGTYHALSVYVKPAEYNKFVMTFRDSGEFLFDIGAMSTSTLSAIASGALTGSITAVGNGWYRCTCILAATGTYNRRMGIRLYNGTTTSYTGDGVKGIFIWGAQLEAGAFATSYIPTTTAQVTRAADAASMTGTNFSSWYRADEGTIYGESLLFDKSGNNRRTLAITNGTSNQTIQIASAYGASLTTPYFEVRDFGAAIQVSAFSTAFANGTFGKMVLGYKANDFALTANAATVTTDTVGSVPAVSQIEIGAYAGAALNGTIKKIAYFPKRIDNATLAAMTTV